jgi:signal transduction histidine kinase
MFVALRDVGNRTDRGLSLVHSGTSTDLDQVMAILSRPDDDDLAELVELVAEICDAEAAGITILRDNAFHVRVTYGIDPFVCPSRDTFCRHTMDVDGVVCIEDARSDPRFENIGWVDGTLAKARFYASAPVYAPTGEMVGRLCVIDSDVRGLTPLQRRSLEAIALSVTQLIELRLLRSSRIEPPVAEVGQATATVVSQLAAELSHDMKVPLTAIIASVEMLEEELGEDPGRAVDALLHRTTRAADRMARMLDQNMDLGVVRAVAPVDVDLAAVTRQLLLDSATLLETEGASVEVDFLPVVRADADDLYSVMQNLLTNAVKFSRPDRPTRVHISSRRVPEGWRIAVRDNGIGIPEDRRVDVFSLFSRVAEGVEGHGIGLATVSRIIGALDGQVGADAAPGGGTEVWFQLP